MKALISKIEPRETGYRVAQIEEQTFPVAEPDLFWVDCDNTIEADKYWYDPSDNSLKLIPVIVQASIVNNQPATEGTQTI
jgi:hypothetical protein